MGIFSRLVRRKRPGPEGVAIRVRTHHLEERRDPQRVIPRTLFWCVAVALVFYLLAHYSVVATVWPVHGTAPGAGMVLMRDLAAAGAWVLLLVVLRYLGYRGNWAVVALPVTIFLLSRPTQFQLFTDPVYQATGGTRAQANALKAERSQLTTILRAYDEDRQQVVFRGPPPSIPDPLEVVRDATRPARNSLSRLASTFTVVLAPLTVLLAFLWARRPGALRWARDNRRWPFALTLLAFIAMVVPPSVRATGKLGGTTPWELFLPLFVMVWAAVLADDAYNLARPGQVVSRRRMLGLMLYGAGPLLPLLALHELGLSIVLAGSFAVMLLVGTRRGWWAALMLVVWSVLVFAAFRLDDRSQTRLALAVNPYRDLAAMEEPAAERWAAKVHQIKLFDANVLAGGWVGEGPGRGHAETAPNAADDGYITAIAAHWGWTGALAFVLLYTAFVIQILAVAVRERSAFERSLATGIAMLIAVPFWLATLGGIRVIPLTGVAAAFAAHGGAKLLASAIALGIVAGVSHRRAEAERLEATAGDARGDASDQGVRVR